MPNCNCQFYLLINLQGYSFVCTNYDEHYQSKYLVIEKLGETVKLFLTDNILERIFLTKTPMTRIYSLQGIHITYN